MSSTVARFEQWLAAPRTDDQYLIADQWPDLDLRGADLSGRDLSGISFVDIDLSGADLTDADLSRSNLHDCRLDGARLHRTFFFKSELHGCSIVGADATMIKPWRSSLWGCRLIDTDLGVASFNQTTLFGGELRGCSLREAIMFDLHCHATEPIDCDFSDAVGTLTQSRDLPPEVPRVPGGPVWDSRQVHFDGRYGPRQIPRDADGNAIRDIPAASMPVELEYALKQLAAFEGSAGRPNWFPPPHPWFERLDWRGADLSGRFLAGAVFDSDLSGANLAGCEASAVVFKQLKLDRVSFADAGLTHANFIDVTAVAADFTGADLRWATLTGRFEGCRFAGARLDGARRGKATFVDCDLPDEADQ